MKVMGIDPGLHGGIAVYDDHGGSHPSWELVKMPIVEYSKNRYDLDLPRLADTFRRFSAKVRFIDTNPGQEVAIPVPGLDLVIVEHPPIVPGNGVLAYRSLFKGWGEIRGILTALDIPFEEPTPQMWKQRILAGTKKDKEAAIYYVKQRFPLQINLPLLGPKSRKHHDGLADAVCLAEYGRRILEGK